MKLFIPFFIRDIGGTATFVRNFSTAMKKYGHDITNQPSLNFDVLFIVADCSLWYPFLAKLLGKWIVQRLDGVYHPATPFGQWYWIYNLKMRIVHNYFADIVIYQSQFSKDSCERFLGKTRAKKTSIIYNGVDLDAIPAKQDFSPHSPIKLLTFAEFRRRDQIQPLLESVKLLDPKQYGFEIFGSYTNNLKHLFDNLPSNIIFRGKKQHTDLLNTIHEYDIFLFSDQSACPNSVLEAMAAGLPVVAFDRGSIPELIKSGYNGEVVSLQKSFLFFTHPYPFEKPDISAFVQSISAVAGNTSYYSKNAVTVSHERFALQKMMARYDDLLKLTS